MLWEFSNFKVKSAKICYSRELSSHDNLVTNSPFKSIFIFCIPSNHNDPEACAKLGSSIF